MKLVVCEDEHMTRQKNRSIIGTHASLMATKSGRYYDLFTTQAKYYTKECETDVHLEELFSY